MGGQGFRIRLKKAKPLAVRTSAARNRAIGVEILLKHIALLFSILIALSLSAPPLAAQDQAPVPAPAPASAEDMPSAPSAPAPPTLPNIGPQLDHVHTVLDQVEAGLQSRTLTTTDLDALHEQLAPLAAKINAAINHLTPQLAGIKARLDQLGPKPDEKAPPESPAVTAERVDQQKSYSDTDELLKRARLLSVQLDQADTAIAARRHAIFTRETFTRATSIASPSLWVDVARELPDDAKTVRNVFASWISDINARLDGWRRFAFWGSLALISLLYWAATRVAHKILAREPSISNPSPLLKALAAWWVALMLAGLPIATIFIINYVFEFFGLSYERLTPFFDAFGNGVIRVATTTAIMSGVFAPLHPNWRLPKVTDAAANGVMQAALSVAVIVSITRLFESLNDVIGASLSVSVATRAVGTLIGALAVAVALWGAGENGEAGELHPPEIEAQRDYFGLLRIFGWCLGAVIVGAVLTGYVAFGSFLLDQAVSVTRIAGGLLMALMLTDEAISTWLRPQTRLGQRLITNVGLHRETLGLAAVLLSGAAKVVIYLFALSLVLAPWGVQSTDFSGNLRAAFFGFRVGEVTISPSTIIVAILIFGVTYGALSAVLQWLDKTLLPQMRFDAGLRNSIKTSLGYVSFIVAASLALSHLGFSFDRLAIVAGALSVGIGFGLQSIVNNFVSGLILLWERAVRVGDWIVVGSDQGFVRKINVRSTEIETFDRAAVIIPNSNLITGIVKNLVRTDCTGRLVISVTVAGTADPEKVREVLLDIAKSHDLVLGMPSPLVLFTNVTGGALSFELTAFVGDVLTLNRVKSDLNFEIYRRFKIEKFFDGPAPDPTKVELLGIDKLEALLRPQSMPAAQPKDLPPQVPIKPEQQKFGTANR